MASIGPPPKVRHGCLKHHQCSRALLGKGCRESTVDLSPPPCLRSLPSSLAERQITEFPAHWRCQALTVVFICIVLVVNWFKCYGNDIYLFFDPVNSKQAGLFFFSLSLSPPPHPGWGKENLKTRYKYKHREKIDVQKLSCTAAGINQISHLSTATEAPFKSRSCALKDAVEHLWHKAQSQSRGFDSWCPAALRESKPTRNRKQKRRLMVEHAVDGLLSW